MTDEEDDWTLYEFQLYTAAGEFLVRIPCIPPFERAPGVAIHDTRYFVLMDDMTYHETAGVHWLPSIPQLEESHAHSDAKPE